ncbi:LPS export ABC transporter ATP-binding protein [Thermus scotoductus]|uniref:LPS export ABC transporter ATP-binding protein n=1 Tax=Thermus scotoductus TaxID=37636 RepID=A0A430V2T6_THESC|nr:LPS export ABC transporter ATP-binding protein [Thermus scotoductus]RTI00163.1 LPS export ABC transporter ATP-binding protein [Thermus scotoductus]RTI17146.1 LPS export ABC transporter ATP-binding protein [Thermus scotoductus]
MDGELLAEGLRKRYGPREVVRGVDLSLKRGEIVALFGPNGAGKTTTFYMMVGFIRPTGGRIFLKGREISQLPMYRRARLGLGYLPQEPSAFRRMTVLENLLAVLEFQPLSREERLEKAKALLEELAIYHLKDRMAYALSGGERRRLEMARALCTDPDFILLDEPFTGVDPKNVKEIQKVIAELRERRGVGVFITDHAVRETLAITDRVYVMYDGQILFHGDPETFARDQGVRRHYLGEDYEL